MVTPMKAPLACEAGAAPTLVARPEFLHDARHETLGVTEQHQCLVHVVQLIVDACEAGAHAALDHHYRAGLIGIEYWHTRDGAVLIASGKGVDYVVGAHHKSDVRQGELPVDFLHLQEL